MSTRARSFFFAIGLFACMSAIFLLYRQSMRPTRVDKPGASVSDLLPGAYKLVSELGPGGVPRSLLFVRKPGGTLKVLSIPLRDGRPAAPGEDGLNPGQACDPFVVDASNEEIQCVVVDADSRQRVQLRWAWSGKSFSALVPDLRPVRGKEVAGKFVLEPAHP